MEHLSDDQLFAELRKRGIYSIVTLYTSDVQQYAKDIDLELTYEQADQVAYYIWSKYDIGPEFESVMDATLEKAEEIAGQQEANHD